jgi:hypothetical protein
MIAVKKSEAELALKLIDLFAQRRLTDVQSVGGTREIEISRNSDNLPPSSQMREG